MIILRNNEACLHVYKQRAFSLTSRELLVCLILLIKADLLNYGILFA